MHFHGHILSFTGMKPDPEKERAIMDMLKPMDSNGVQCLIRFAIT